MLDEMSKSETVRPVFICVSYLEGEPVLAGAEPHVLHGGAVDHHLSHTLAGHKHWSAGFKQNKILLEEEMLCWFSSCALGRHLKSKCK